MIESGPGTGKTTTISHLTSYFRATNKDAYLRMHPNITEEQLNILRVCQDAFKVNADTSIIGMTYNREAAEHLQSRTHKSVECKTHHGWGYSVINSRHKYVRINNGRSRTLIEKVAGQTFNKIPDKYEWLTASKFLDKIKDEYCEPSEENLILMTQKYDDLAPFKITSRTIELIRKLLPAHKVIDKTVGISNADQVWLPLFMLREPIYDLAIVDEAQDQSPSRMELAMRIARNHIFVGDKNQSINAWSGADSKSMDRIEAIADAVLPLKLSFRCPPNVIEMLNRMKPKARLRGLPKAKGVEQRVQLKNVGTLLKSKHDEGEPYSAHMMICRYNAPLVRIAYHLIKADIPCRVLGDRLVDSLVTTIEGRNATTVDELETKLNKYEKTISEGLQPYIAELFKDKINCIRIVLPMSNTVEDVINNLKNLLKPKDPDHVKLATIHKSKGMEEDNIWVLFPPIKSERATTPEQIEQESNVEFVAYSRTKRDTYIVVEDN